MFGTEVAVIHHNPIFNNVCVLYCNKHGCPGLLRHSIHYMIYGVVLEHPHQQL